MAAQTIRRMFAQQPFAGNQVVAALPRDLVHVKNLRLPRMPAEDLAAAVHNELETLFAFDTADAQIQFLPAGEVRQGADTRRK